MNLRFKKKNYKRVVDNVIIHIYTKSYSYQIIIQSVGLVSLFKMQERFLCYI